MNLHDLSADAIENAARGVPAMNAARYQDRYPASITLRKFIGHSVEIDYNGFRFRADLLKGTEDGSGSGTYEYKLTPKTSFDLDDNAGA